MKRYQPKIEPIDEISATQKAIPFSAERREDYVSFFHAEASLDDFGQAIRQLERMVKDIAVATRLAGEKLAHQLEGLLAEIQETKQELSP